MGKRSKREGKGRGYHKKNSLLTEKAIPMFKATSTGKENNVVESLIQKINKADPCIRHATLTALSSTFYNSDSLISVVNGLNDKDTSSLLDVANSSSSSNLTLSFKNSKLLEALTKRILDVDIPCATSAIGCLFNYISFFAVPTQTHEDGTEDYFLGERNDHHESEFSLNTLSPILLERIALSLRTCQSLQQTYAESVKSISSNINNQSSTDKTWALIKQQWSLLSLTLETLAEVIENFTVDEDKTYITLFNALSTVLTSTTFLSGTKRETDVNIILDAGINAARALHSLLDDNDSLITRISSTKISPSPPTQQVNIPSIFLVVPDLVKIINNTKMPLSLRLHASGAILSLRKVLVEKRKDTSKSGEDEKLIFQLQSCISNQVITLLLSTFDVKVDSRTDEDIIRSKTDSPIVIVQKMIHLLNCLTAQKQDEAMEYDIVKEINARKEPARLIAKRQKNMKEHQIHNTKGFCSRMQEDVTMKGQFEKPLGETGSSTAVVEKDIPKDIHDNAADEEGQGDFREALDKEIQTWRRVYGSYKLALDLVVNLFSKRDIVMENDNNEDFSLRDIENHVWDSDDEAKLLAVAKKGSSQNHQSSLQMTPFDGSIFTSITSYDLPEKIILFFRNWIMFIPNIGEKCPMLVADDVDEMLSSCTNALQNMIACDIPFWTTSASSKLPSSVNDPKTSCNGVECFRQELVSLLKSSTLMLSTSHNEAMFHITSVLLSLMQYHIHARKIVDSPTLDILSNLLSIGLNKEDEDTKGVSLCIDCNVIALMGMVCNEPHPNSVNAQICAALVHRLKSASFSKNFDKSAKNLKESVVVLNEIYNVLMDIYGKDNSNDAVFDQFDVLGHFQRTLPGFKRQIKKIPSDERIREEIDVWSETALNVSRFIKYKLG